MRSASRRSPRPRRSRRRRVLRPSISMRTPLLRRPAQSLRRWSTTRLLRRRASRPQPPRRPSVSTRTRSGGTPHRLSSAFRAARPETTRATRRLPSSISPRPFTSSSSIRARIRSSARLPTSRITSNTTRRFSGSPSSRRICRCLLYTSLGISVEKFDYSDGNLRVRVRIAVFSYPGRDLRGEVPAGATLPGARPGDKGAEDQLLSVVAGQATDLFAQNFK